MCFLNNYNRDPTIETEMDEVDAMKRTTAQLHLEPLMIAVKRTNSIFLSTKGA